ncbi:MAG: NIPSNAP family protein [Verrucomicrobiota bacterium]
MWKLAFVFVTILIDITVAEPKWNQSYSAGYTDKNGEWAGGSEIMHLAAHKEKLYASNGYWVDARWEIPPDGKKQSAQVLRLDTAGGEWVVDLDAGKSNGLGLQYMKGNILKSVTFTHDGSGALLPEPRQLLIFAAGANFERGGAVSAWVRDDKTGEWTHTLVRHGSSLSGVRWVPRDMEVYRDKVTGVERLFMSLGNPGIISGVYDEETPGGILWDRNLEYPFLTEGSFRTRPLGMTIANGHLFFSEGDSIYQRIDGERPDYIEILDLFEDTDTDVGGIRGLTSAPNPNGTGDSLLFLWAPGERSVSQIKRLDPDGRGGYRLNDEMSIMDLMSDALGLEIAYTLGAHNMMYPFTDPTTGETNHIIGFQGNIRGQSDLKWKGSALYAGAMYAIRRGPNQYTVHEVNNRYRPGKPILVSPRTFCASPFGDEHIYIAGHDSSRKISDNMAWVFNAPQDVVFGVTAAADVENSKPKPEPPEEWREGPIYELRIYSPNEHRFDHLKTRFREHTDRLFRKHGMEPIGYWTPTDGPAKKRRRFIYILKHASRYAAYRSWNHFNNDREWEAVTDQPQFRGLLSSKPISIFMTSAAAGLEVDQTGGVYELRIHASAAAKSGASWKPFDTASEAPIQLLHHSPGTEVKRDAVEAEERIFLKAMDFSPLR